jgi:hypothetical protein
MTEDVTQNTDSISSFTLYGASDDLIELEGDLYEEVTAYNAGACQVVVDDVVVATIEYGLDGMWTIAPEAETGALSVEVTHAAVDDDLREHPGTTFTRYSDVIVITGPMLRVKVADEEFDVASRRR